METAIEKIFSQSHLSTLRRVFLIFFTTSFFWSSGMSQEVCQADTSFSDILFVIDNSGSIDDTEYNQFSDIIMATIQNVQSKCQSSQIAVMHYGGAFGLETFVEYNFSRINDIADVERQYCTTRDQFGNCPAGGDDLNAAMGDVLTMIEDGTLNRNPINKLSIVIFTDAFGFDENCGFINCSVIRPFTNIDRLKLEEEAQVTVVGASSQAEPSLLAIYASPGGTFDNVRLFDQDCPSTADGCVLPRKYIPVEFDSPVLSSSDSIASCVICTVEVIGGVIANAGQDQTLCEEEDLPATLTAELTNGTAPFTFVWDQDIGEGNMIQVTPLVTTTYTVTITDNNGCSATDAVTIFVENCIPDCGASPIISCPSGALLCPNEDISTDALGMATGGPGDPNCPTPSISFRDSVVTISACNQSIYRIWSAVYPNDNSSFGSSDCIQLIQIADVVPPTIALPDEITVDSDNNCIASVTWEEPMVDDNCSVEEVTSNIASGSNFALGTTYVVYTAFDMCGNQTIDSFAVNVLQMCCLDGPIISCPPDITGCPMGTTDPMMTGMATATSSSELCGEAEITFSDATENVGSCPGQIIITRTWIATDIENPDLVSTCEQKLFLLDTIPPVLLGCPPDVTIDPDNPIHSWDDPMVSENCGFSLTYNIPSGSTFATGDTKVIATATDMCGNVDTCFFIVTVPEEVAIICPPDTTLRCLDTLLSSNFPIPQVSSSCELCTADPTNCINVTTSIDTIIFNGLSTTYQIRYVATDLCGTDNECTTQVTLENGSFLDCQEDIEVTAPPFGFAYVSWEKPVFLTCCSLCKTKQIPGFLYMGQFGESYYYCSYARVRWEKAQRISEDNGGNLVTINSRQENDFLAQRLIERHAYIGLTDAAIEGDYQWASGQIDGYRRWKPGQPNNDGNEDFTEMDAQGYWYDVDGREKREFIMEIQGCDHVTQIGGPDSGSKFRPGTTTITYRAEDGCGNADECSFDIIVLPPVVEEAFVAESRSIGQKTLEIVPNPANVSLFIKAESQNIESLDLYSMSGQLVLTTKNIFSDQVTIDVTKYQSGIYLIKVITSSGQLEIRKVIIE